MAEGLFLWELGFWLFWDGFEEWGFESLGFWLKFGEEGRAAATRIVSQNVEQSRVGFR